MSTKKFLALMASAATLTAALDAYEVAEFNALLIDVKAHLTQYISLAENNPNFTIPDGVLECYTQLTTYTNDSYTTLFTMINFAQVTTAMEMLPWYSSRIEPLMSSYFKAHSITETNDPDATGSSATSSAASSSSSSVATTSSSSSSKSVATSSSAPSSDSSSSDSSSSTSKSSSSKVSTTLKTSTTTTSSSSASSTSSKSKSANAANLLTAGMGAAVMGAAALLL